MYLIRSTKSFKRSFQKIKASGIKDSVLFELDFIVNQLSRGHSLTVKYRDHELQGDYSGYRECHIKGDFLLVYKIEKHELILVLANIGSHSELFD